MQVYNQTPYVYQQTMGMDVAGREYLSLVVKGTFGFPDNRDQTPTPCPAQTPLVEADEFTGEPGYSATKWETDFAFRKAKCDVVLQGSAYAPGRKPVERVQVGLKVGEMQKTFQVVGAREWRVLGPVVMATDPQPFTKMQFSYDTAFGGVCALDPDDELPPAYMPNPVGMGFAAFKNQSRLSGTPLPNTEEDGAEVTSPYEDYRPMGLGPIARSKPERLKYAGTYDDDWKDNVFPFLPKDFDERYYQCVGRDQQIAHPATGTPVVLLNLTPRGKEAFYLPETTLPIRIFRGRETVLQDSPKPDTILIDAEARLFSMVWRVEVPIKRTVAEFTEAWIGNPTPGMARAKTVGKTYVPASTLSDYERIRR